MNKQDLKAKWGSYCDTDKLVDDMSQLLNKYYHRNSEQGLCVMLDKYFTNKEPLIKLISSSKNYKGDMRIILQKEFKRDNTAAEVSNFCKNFTEKVGANKVILKYENDKGKSLTDSLKTGIKVVNIRNNDVKKKLEGFKKDISDFNLTNGATNESVERNRAFKQYIKEDFYFISDSFLPRDIATLNNEKMTLSKGMKTSRAFNKVCHYYGVDKASKYEKLFAQYSDLVSDLKRKLYFLISVNPLDYLTMSFGVSWQSCHTIADGGYCGGCISYMLDGSSIITFAIDNMDKPIHEIRKIYRNMFYYKDYMFVQSRIYPQGNDGAIDLYKQFREIMQEEFTDILHLNKNMWRIKAKGNDVPNYTNSIGVHYPDYKYQDDCVVYYPSEKADDMEGVIVPIGHTGICPHCGMEFSASNFISHRSCLQPASSEIEVTANYNA